MTDKQYKLVARVLKKEKVPFTHEKLALEFSKGRTDVLKDLTHLETQNLLVTYRKRTPKERMKSKILSMAHEIRWELPSGKIDMARLDAWCVKYTPAHTNFNSISEKELPIVVGVFERMYKGVLKGL